PMRRTSTTSSNHPIRRFRASTERRCRTCSTCTSLRLPNARLSAKAGVCSPVAALVDDDGGATRVHEGFVTDRHSDGVMIDTPRGIRPYTGIDHLFSVPTQLDRRQRCTVSKLDAKVPVSPKRNGTFLFRLCMKDGRCVCEVSRFWVYVNFNQV